MSYIGLKRRDRVSKEDTPEDVKRFQSLAARQEPKIARAFARSIANVLDSATITETAALIEAGQVEQVVASYTSDPELDFAPFAAAISETALAGAKLTAELMPTIRKAELVEFVFNPVNPRLTDFAQTITAQRIREINEGTRQTIREVIRQGTLDGENPLTTARTVRQSIGLTQKQAMAVQNFRRMLETGSSEAMTRALRDKRFDPTLRRLMEGERVSPQKIDTMVERYRQRYIKYRSETIARTETIRSLGGSQQRFIQDAVDQKKIDQRQVKRFWHYTQDELTRAEHRQIPAMNPNGVGLEEPFRTPLGPLQFPADPSGAAANTINCRCVVFTRVIARELIEGLDDPGTTPPPPQPKPQGRPETGGRASVGTLPPNPIPFPPMRGPSASIQEVISSRSLVDRDRIARSMAEAPESAVLDRIARVKSLKKVDDGQSGSYYETWNKRIAMRLHFSDSTAEGVSRYNKTFRHEYGHHLDGELGVAAAAEGLQVRKVFRSWAAVDDLAADGAELTKARTGISLRGSKTKTAAMGKQLDKVFGTVDELFDGIVKGRWTAEELIESRGFTLAEVTELYQKEMALGLNRFASRFAAAIDHKDHNFLLGKAPDWRNNILLAGVSDTVEASAAGAFGHWFGHGKSYYKKSITYYSHPRTAQDYGGRGNLPLKKIGQRTYTDYNTTQAFANWTEAQTSGSDAVKKMWRVLLPRTDSAFRKIIDEADDYLGERVS